MANCVSDGLACFRGTADGPVSSEGLQRSHYHRPGCPTPGNSGVSLLNQPTTTHQFGWLASAT